MGKVLTFEDFAKKNPSLTEENNDASLKEHTHDTELKHYMFFQNLTTVKHYLEEIMAMDKSKVDALLSDGHDWAVDHLSTSTDDIAEVTNWLRGEMEEVGEEPMSAEVISTEFVTDPAGEEKTELEMMDDEKEGEEDEKEDEGEGEEDEE
jgi:hypothetical protein